MANRFGLEAPDTDDTDDNSTRRSNRRWEDVRMSGSPATVRRPAHPAPPQKQAPRTPDKDPLIPSGPQRLGGEDWVAGSAPALLAPGPPGASRTGSRSDNRPSGAPTPGRGPPPLPPPPPPPFLFDKCRAVLDYAFRNSRLHSPPPPPSGGQQNSIRSRGGRRGERVLETDCSGYNSTPDRLHFPFREKVFAIR
ncbi:unnamed protein product [Lota lota]